MKPPDLQRVLGGYGGERLATRRGIVHQGHLIEELEDLHAKRLKIKTRDLDEIAQNLVNTGTPSASLIVEQQHLEEHFLQLTEGIR